MQKSYIFFDAAAANETESKEYYSYLCELKEKLSPDYFETTTTYLQKYQPDYSLQFKSEMNNFDSIRASDCVIMVFPDYESSNHVVELAFANVIRKKIIIFYKEQLPDVIEFLEKPKPNIKMFQYSKLSDIDNMLFSDDSKIFEWDENIISSFMINIL